MVQDSIRQALDILIGRISEQNYDQTFAYYRLWFEITQEYVQKYPDQIFDSLLDNRGTHGIQPGSGKLIHSAAHLILRFARDAESDDTLGPYSTGLQDRFCAKILQYFFESDMQIVQFVERRMGTSLDWWLANVNYVAHWANLGYIKESTIRNHILQPLVSNPMRVYDHHVDALIILFKIAGATFEKYVDPLVVDRCFECLKGHYSNNTTMKQLVQEVIELRNRGWEGPPPPPVLTTGERTRANQRDPAATPIVTSFGLPSGDRELQTSQPQPSPLVPVTALEVETDPVTPVTQSPSISIASLSDFTVADDSDDEVPIDPTAVTPNDTFYLEDGNVEVLCGNTLFRVHTSVLSFHSPALRRMFAQTNLAAADSPNGCPRILPSDSATDFATLMKMIYLPGFPEKNKMPDFTTFSSLLRITTKYELPAVRSQLLELVCDAYPETFEGLVPSKALGENVFSGPAPHPNEVLNLFVQQKLTSTLPMAYYMAARRGLRSLVDPHHPASARLSPETFQTAAGGLMELREMELKEIHRLIMVPHRCLSHGCVSPKTLDPGGSDAERKVIDKMTGSSQSGTKVLQVFSLDEICGDDLDGFCKSCEEWWESGHVEVRKKAWAALPSVFGLRAWACARV